MLILFQQAEERQLRKEKKKLGKNAAAGDEDEEDQPFDGIRGLSSNALTEDSIPSSSKGKQKALEDGDEEDAPILINRDFANLSAVFEKADVILEVLDARDPLAYHTSNLAEYTKEKKHIILINKIGTSFKATKRSIC